MRALSWVLACWLFAAHEGFEAVDLLAGAEHDQGVTGADDVLGGGGGVEPALQGSDGEDHIAPVFSPIWSFAMAWFARGDSLGTSNSSSRNSMPFSPRVPTSRKSTMRG